jgi:hypothetical protein
VWVGRCSLSVCENTQFTIHDISHSSKNEDTLMAATTWSCCRSCAVGRAAYLRFVEANPAPTSTMQRSPRSYYPVLIRNDGNRKPHNPLQTSKNLSNCYFATTEHVYFEFYANECMDFDESHLHYNQAGAGRLRPRRAGALSRPEPATAIHFPDKRS